MYKPSEIENLSDRRDRVQSRLYTRMVGLLTEVEPDPEREIWTTAATLYRSVPRQLSKDCLHWVARCGICGQLLTSSTSRLLLCHPNSATINNTGKVVPKHER